MKNFYIVLFAFITAVVAHKALAGVLASATSSPSSTTVNHPVAVTLAIINGGASALSLSDVKLTVSSTSNPTNSKLPVAFSVFNKNGPVINLPANSTTSVAGGNVVFFSPSTGITDSGTGTYSIGGSVYTSDGSITQISSAAVQTIHPVSLPAYERQ